MAEILIAKQRNGPTGVVKLAFLKPITKFESLASGGAAADLITGADKSLTARSAKKIKADGGLHAEGARSVRQGSKVGRPEQSFFGR